MHIPDSQPLRSVAFVALVFSGMFTLTGCVTDGYKLADKKTPPVVALNLVAAQSSTEIAVRTVIVYQGPGSWKREAYWDEYVISMANHGGTPLVISSAVLVDGKGEAIVPGDDPWKLEKISKSWWERVGADQASTYFVLGLGAAAGVTLALGAYAAAAAGASIAGSVAAAGVIGVASIIALPAIAGGTIYMNQHRKHQVEAEFSRRRLVFPVTVPPGGVAQGSLFFQLTPSPKRLVVRDSRDGQPHETGVDLTPLAGLHLKAPPGPVASPVADEKTK